MRYFYIILASLIVGVSVSAESYKPNPKPPTDGLIGSNYTPAYAVNQVQFWHDFRPGAVDGELAAARRHFGVSTLRVYLHDINFFQEKAVLLANMEAFLAICSRHEMRPGFVFFDSCHRHEGIFLERPTEPVSGYHNGRWAQSPQARDIDMKAIAGDAAWTDYVLEGRVTIKPVKNAGGPGNAGLLFRVNDPGEDLDDLRGYAVTYDGKKLVLSKIVNGAGRNLATYRDTPILSGAIGARTERVSAMLDNIVVLPQAVLEQDD